MWTLTEVNKIENSWGTWHALVTLSKNAVPESFYIRFNEEPTQEQASTAGTELATQKNVLESGLVVLPVDNNILTREAFFGRFTNTEIANIYAASAGNANLFAYVKKMEINPTIRKNVPDVIAGLALLEAVGLLGAGRAAEILA